MLLYEIKIKYTRQTGEDNPKRESETYLIEGLNCSEVEKRLMDVLKPYIFGDHEIPSCKKAQYKDIFPSVTGDYWFKFRVEMIVVDESGKEKRHKVSILVQEADIEAAIKKLKHELSGFDYDIASVTKSNIIDVYRSI